MRVFWFKFDIIYSLKFIDDCHYNGLFDKTGSFNKNFITWKL